LLLPFFILFFSCLQTGRTALGSDCIGGLEAAGLPPPLTLIGRKEEIP
jgi:hypothetical protein